MSLKISTLKKKKTQKKKFTNHCQPQDKDKHSINNSVVIRKKSEDDTNRIRPRTPPTECTLAPPSQNKGHSPRKPLLPTPPTQSPGACVAPMSDREKLTPPLTRPPAHSETSVGDEYNDDANANNKHFNTVTNSRMPRGGIKNCQKRESEHTRRLKPLYGEKDEEASDWMPLRTQIIKTRMDIMLRPRMQSTKYCRV